MADISLIARRFNELSFDFPKQKLQFNVVILSNLDEQIAREKMKKIIDETVEATWDCHCDEAFFPECRNDYNLTITKPSRRLARSLVDGMSKTVMLYEAASAAYEQGLDHLIVLISGQDDLDREPDSGIYHPFHEKFLYIWLKDRSKNRNSRRGFAVACLSMYQIFEVVKYGRIEGSEAKNSFQTLHDLDLPPFSMNELHSTYYQRISMAQKLCSKMKLPTELTMMVQDHIANFEPPNELLEHNYQFFRPTANWNRGKSIHVYSLISLKHEEIDAITGRLNAELEVKTKSKKDSNLKFCIHPWLLPYAGTRRHILAACLKNLRCHKALAQAEDEEIIFLCKNPWSDAIEIVIAWVHRHGCLYLRSVPIPQIKERLFLSPSPNFQDYSLANSEYRDYASYTSVEALPSIDGKFTYSEPGSFPGWTSLNLYQFEPRVP